MEGEGNEAGRSSQDCRQSCLETQQVDSSRLVAVTECRTQRGLAFCKQQGDMVRQSWVWKGWGTGPGQDEVALSWPVMFHQRSPAGEAIGQQQTGC